jgi:hypothetical protein
MTEENVAKAKPPLAWQNAERRYAQRFAGAFADHGIEMAYPQRNIHLRSGSAHRCVMTILFFAGHQLET